jgi:hypothetical protein
MRNSTSGLLFGLLLTAGLVILALTLAPGVWLMLISHMVKTNQSAGLPPFSTTPISAFAFPTPSTPIHIGQEIIVGEVAIRVTGVSHAANARAAGVSTYQSLQKGQEYLLVDILVRCLSAKESCHLSGFDFGVRSASGLDTPSEFTSGSSGLPVFEGGAISPRQSMSGSLVFIVGQNDRGLKL